MIAIVNMGFVNSEDDFFGEANYEVRVNREVIARFSHTRSDGLSECLRKAAAAVDEAKHEFVENFLEAARRHVQSES